MSTLSTFNTVKLEDSTQAIIKVQPKGPVIMPEFGNRERDEMSRFLKLFELAGRAQKWSDDDLMERLPLSLTHSAVAWYSRNKFENTWQEQKDLMIKEFRPHGFPDYKRKALENRMMQKDESVNPHFEGVMLLYDVLVGLNKTFTDQEKADGFTRGLHEALYTYVTMIASTNPQDFGLTTKIRSNLNKTFY